MKYRDYIKSLPCSVCDDDTTVQQHHAIDLGIDVKGLGIKTPEALSIPLCAHHHHQLHLNDHLWEHMNGSQAGHILKTILKASLDGWTMEKIDVVQ